MKGARDCSKRATRVALSTLTISSCCISSDWNRSVMIRKTTTTTRYDNVKCLVEACFKCGSTCSIHLQYNNGPSLGLSFISACYHRLYTISMVLPLPCVLLLVCPQDSCLSVYQSQSHSHFLSVLRVWYNALMEAVKHEAPALVILCVFVWMNVGDVGVFEMRLNSCYRWWLHVRLWLMTCARTPRYSKII